MRKENKILKRKVEQKYKIIGESKAILDVIQMIDKVAPTDARVLITGENGTGKELVAHQLHQKSDRKKTGICGSELCGHSFRTY